MKTKEVLNINSKDKFYNDYCNVVRTAQKLLKENVDWQDRYTRYRGAIIALNRELSLRPSKNLYYYTTISDIKNTSKEKLKTQIRYKGQLVGKLDQVQDVSGLYKYLLIIEPELTKTNCETFLEYKDIPALNDQNGTFKKVECDWQSSEEAKAFRKFFWNDLQKRCNSKGQEEHGEHTLESALLSELEKTTSDNKYIRWIQPIKLKNMRFQFPTALSASKLKNDPINANILSHLLYSRGGIDILARRKEDTKSYLTVIELKDEFNEKEKPEIAIRQAIAYATFMRELIRYDAANSVDSQNWWYSIFGLNSKTLDNDLVIKCVVAMPGISDPNLFIHAGLTEIPLTDGTDKYQDKLLLHCINIELKDGDKNSINNLIPDDKF